MSETEKLLQQRSAPCKNCGFTNPATSPGPSHTLLHEGWKEKTTQQHSQKGQSQTICAGTGVLSLAFECVLWWFTTGLTLARAPGKTSQQACQGSWHTPWPLHGEIQLSSGKTLGTFPLDMALRHQGDLKNLCSRRGPQQNASRDSCVASGSSVCLACSSASAVSSTFFSSSFR